MFGKLRGGFKWVMILLMGLALVHGGLKLVGFHQSNNLRAASVQTASFSRGDFVHGGQKGYMKAQLRGLDRAHGLKQVPAYHGTPRGGWQGRSYGHGMWFGMGLVLLLIKLALVALGWRMLKNSEDNRAKKWIGAGLIIVVLMSLLQGLLGLLAVALVAYLVYKLFKNNESLNEEMDQPLFYQSKNVYQQERDFLDEWERKVREEEK